MPQYTVSHTCPLLASQRDDLAAAITDIHSELFTTPRFFVQVRFQPIASYSATDTTVDSLYIGGQQQTTGNHILAFVRSGGTRSQEDFDTLTTKIVDAWKRIVPLPVAKTVRSAASASEAATDNELHSIMLVGGMFSGYKAGFLMPPAGGAVEWLKENWSAFEEKAQAGEVRFVELVKEVKKRKLLGDEEVDEEERARRHARRLEEMLGWGDAA